MKNVRFYSKLVVFVCAAAVFLHADDNKNNKYVGIKVCGPCHRSDKQGKQFDIWQKSKHAGAYKTLLSDKANEIAKTKGLTKPAAESPECLQCHVIGYDDPKLVDKTFDMKDGVQCETCHAAGSGYKNLSVMKDKGKAVAAGLTLYKDEKEIEKFCRTCHNEKSPQFKGFKFEEMWAKIKHPVPAKK